MGTPDPGTDQDGGREEGETQLQRPPSKHPGLRTVVSLSWRISLCVWIITVTKQTKKYALFPRNCPRKTT